MRSFGYLRITTLTSLTHGHANGYQLSLIFIDIFAASSTSLNGLHLQQLPTIRSPRLAALLSPFPPQPCLLHCKCYCGKTMTTQHSAPRSRRNATSRVRSVKQLFAVQPDAPLQRAGQMARLHNQAQSVPTIGPTRGENPRAYSILRHDMPHREDTPPDTQHSLTYSITSWLSPHYMSWLPKQYTTGSRLTLQGWQSWFCQHLGIAPPAIPLRCPIVLMPTPTT